MVAAMQDLACMLGTSRIAADILPRLQLSEALPKEDRVGHHHSPLPTVERAFLRPNAKVQRITSHHLTGRDGRVTWEDRGAVLLVPSGQRLNDC